VSQELRLYSFFTDSVRALPARSGERAAWLPDGSGLVYSAVNTDERGLSLRLRLLGLGEAPASRDLTDGTGAELSPAVSPNGEAVAFTRRSPDGPQAQIWLVAAAGGTPVRLSAEGPHQDTQPLWSPDGSAIAFVRSSAVGPRQSEAITVDVTSGMERVALPNVVQLLWAP
jgi:Tol biopolymer transport system component